MQTSNGYSLKELFVVAIVFICLLHPVPAWADNDELTAFSFIKFIGGMMTAFSIHEGGHALVGLLTDTELEWEWGNYNQPLTFTERSDNDTDGFIINSAGFVFQATSAEIFLQVDKINKNDAFVRGMMTWNILNPILYALDYWVFSYTNQPVGQSYQGDLQGIEYYSDKTSGDVVAATITAIALLQGYRFIKSQSWAPPWLAGNSHRLNGQQLVNVRPLSSDGFFLSYKIRF